MRQMFVFNGQTLYIQGLDIDVELDCTKYVILSLVAPPQEVISTKKGKYITNCFFYSYEYRKKVYLLILLGIHKEPKLKRIFLML
jgi:hypothetical protein